MFQLSRLGLGPENLHFLSVHWLDDTDAGSSRTTGLIKQELLRTVRPPPFPMAEDYMGHGSAPPLTVCHSPKALPEHCSQSERRNECFLHPVLSLVFAWEESQRMRKTRFQYLNLNGLINTAKNYCFLKENSQYKPHVVQEASRNQKRSTKNLVSGWWPSIYNRPFMATAYDQSRQFTMSEGGKREGLGINPGGERRHLTWPHPRRKSTPSRKKASIYKGNTWEERVLNPRKQKA